MKQRNSYDAGVRCAICDRFLGTVKYGTLITLGALVAQKIADHERTTEHQQKLAHYVRDRSTSPWTVLRRVK